MTDIIDKKRYVCCRCGACACDECFQLEYLQSANASKVYTAGNSNKCRHCKHPHREEHDPRKE